ncbi:MAG: TonB-dependent receptor [Candidatus Omnitrophica bacterium]|nr:TonB-dependent receptor [Candidatus Omnitrophota bacterium]
MRRVSVVILCFLFCGYAFAEEEKSSFELEPIVVTPWRAEESFSDVSRNVTIITEDDIEASSAQSLPELLQDKSNAVVSDYLGNPKGVVVDIRGFGEASPSNVLVLIDGRRTNQVDLSGVDWGQIDLNSIERIEMVPGPSTVLYGDNASAGVINIITKKGRTEKPKVVVAGELGSYQYHKEYTNISGMLDKQLKQILKGEETERLMHLDYFFSFSNTDTSGYRANNDYWASDYFGRATFSPTDMFELNLSSGYHRDHYGMPGALYLSEIEEIGRRGTVYPNDRGFTSDMFVTAEPRTIFSFGDNQIRASVAATFRERRTKGLSVSQYGQYETCHHTTTYELRPKLETKILWKKIDNNLTMGIDYLHTKDQTLSGNRLNQQQDETDIYKETIGFYAHDNLKFSKRFIANAGARGEWADYTFKQKRLVVNHDTKKLKTAAFNFGGGYKYNDKSQIYVDIERSFRFPNTEEYYQNKGVFWGTEYGGLNSDITYQQGMSYEIGVKDVSFEWLRLNADVFLMDVKNEIYYNPSTFKNSNYSPKVRHYGLEVEAQFDLLKGKLQPFINWTLQESFFKGGIYAGNQVPLVPKNKISAGITITPIEKLFWTIGANYIGSSYKISDQNNIAAKLKDYATLNTKLGYTYKFASIWGSIKNILDKKYYPYGVTNAAGTAETFYPAPERQFEGGLTLTF